jgi:hypothetical protein
VTVSGLCKMIENEALGKQIKSENQNPAETTSKH